ncbi:hypothetical protein HMI55_006746 [Coelomomyces lativittatus]|nr:hypothetical protein HMI55_006746 [Coelomomyces lativittatus]
MDEGMGKDVGSEGGTKEKVGGDDGLFFGASLGDVEEDIDNNDDGAVEEVENIEVEVAKDEEPNAKPEEEVGKVDEDVEEDGKWGSSETINEGFLSETICIDVSFPPNEEKVEGINALSFFSFSVSFLVSSVL